MTEPLFRSQSIDDRMDEATDRARNSFKILWRELSWEMRRIIPGLDISAVKHGFTTDRPQADPAIEHMWVGNISFDGRYITGSLLNQPQYINELNCGDRVTFNYDRISDWMYAIGGKAYGAFTVNLLRDRMTTAERENHDRAWNMDFGDPQQIFIAPNYSFSDFSIALSTEIPEHQMSENILVQSEANIQQMGDRINDPSFCGMTMLQFESLAGNLTQVELLLKYGADKSIANANGQTALDLSQMFNWSKIANILVNNS